MKTILTAILFLQVLSAQGNASIIKCTSWSEFSEKVALVVNVNGSSAQVMANLNGQKLSFPAKVAPWHNGPNRCANYASGIIFSAMPPSIPYFHIVTIDGGAGCSDPSAISYTGFHDPEVYLTCSMDGKVLPAQ